MTAIVDHRNWKQRAAVRADELRNQRGPEEPHLHVQQVARQSGPEHAPPGAGRCGRAMLAGKQVAAPSRQECAHAQQRQVCRASELQRRKRSRRGGEEPGYTRDRRAAPDEVARGGSSRRAPTRLRTGRDRRANDDERVGARDQHRDRGYSDEAQERIHGRQNDPRDRSRPAHVSGQIS